MTTSVPEAVDRPRALATSIRSHVAQGWRVESQTSTDAILVRGRGCNHVLHLILTVLTFGFWAPIWLVMWYVAREQRLSVSVDDYGNTLVSKL